MEPDEEILDKPRARSLAPVVVLLVAAAVFSYLACFAIPAALVSSELMHPWPADADPRPRWMLETFCWIMGISLTLGGLVRFLSWRQCRRIDAMAD